MTEVQKRLKSDGLKTVVAQADATTEKTLASKYNVAGPVMHYWVKGEKITEYEGGKTTEDIYSWLKGRERPDVSELLENQVDQFLNDTMAGSYSLLARVKKNSARHKAFLKSLGAVMDVQEETTPLEDKFAVIYLPDTADAKADASLLLRQGGVAQPHAVDIMFDGSWTAVDISIWANKNSMPTLGRSFSTRYSPSVMERIGLEGFVVVCTKAEDDDDDDKGTDAVYEKFSPLLLPLAAKYPRWKFTLCDSSNLDKRAKESLLASFVESPRQIPDDFITLRIGEKRRYVLEGEEKILSPATVHEFLAEAQAGRWPGRHRSEDRPRKEVDEHGITILTGDTFHDKVKDESKDVFVMFTHPRCGHCEDLHPVWEQFAQEVKKRNWGKRGAVIAKLDMEKNDCEEIISEYPRLIVYPAVKAERKMTKKQVLVPDNRIQSLRHLSIERLMEFFLGNAVNLEVEDELELEAELSRKSKKKSKASGASSKAPKELEAEVAKTSKKKSKASGASSKSSKSASKDGGKRNKGKKARSKKEAEEL
eukprot:TRINITY_DN1182_c0_g1_i3.p1 TRINITY_DN1182_c0_g1~~TRINITY_DN1182_c0_g1_i3.p1  ORF type:complete len:536 (+),score=166.88 TRINITY_DN1182_c0_g1_i3:381-1988(+)